MRLLIGGIALVLLAASQGHRLGLLRPHRNWLALGAIAVAGYQLCFFTGTTRTGVALGTVLALGSAPIFAGLINTVLYRRAPSRRWVVGTVLAIGGIALITRSQPSAQTDLGGIFAALGAGLGWAVYAMIGQERIRTGLDSTTCMAAMFMGGALLSLPLLAVGNAGWILTPSGAALSLYLGVITVGVVYAFMGLGLRVLPAPTVVTLTLSEPVTAAILAAVLLRQDIGLAGWVGVIIVMVALVITSEPATPDDQITGHPPSSNSQVGRTAMLD